MNYHNLTTKLFISYEVCLLEVKKMYSRNQKRISLSRMTDEGVVRFIESVEDEANDSEYEVSEGESEDDEFLICDDDLAQMSNYIEQLENASSSDFFSTISSLDANHEDTITKSEP